MQFSMSHSGGVQAPSDLSQKLQSFSAGCIRCPWGPMLSNRNPAFARSATTTGSIVYRVAFPSIWSNYENKALYLGVADQIGPRHRLSRVDRSFCEFGGRHKNAALSAPC